MRRVITVTNFAAANVDDVLISDGTVIDADGTYQFEPGDYTAVGRVAGQVVTDAVEFTIEACPAAEPTPTRPTPDGGVGGATGTPNVTLPPTDTLAAGSTAPSGDSWRLILLAMAGIMAGALLLTPADAVIRRDRRRR